MTKLQNRAESIVDRSWPDAPSADEADTYSDSRRHLVRRVKEQIKNNSVHGDGWNDAKKLRRRILRERKQLAKDTLIGRAVKRRYDDETTYYIVDVRIRDGKLQYGLAEDRAADATQWVKRHRQRDWPGGYSSWRWRFASNEE